MILKICYQLTRAADVSSQNQLLWPVKIHTLVSHTCDMPSIKPGMDSTHLTYTGVGSLRKIVIPFPENWKQMLISQTTGENIVADENFA